MLNSSKPGEPVLVLPVVKPDTSDKSTFVNMMHKKLWLEFKTRVTNLRKAAAVFERQMDRQMDQIKLTLLTSEISCNLMKDLLNLSELDTNTFKLNK